MKGRKGNNPNKGIVENNVPAKNIYAGAGSPAAKAVIKRKRGGAVVETKPEGVVSKLRLDRPGRKLGGRVGADKAPLSSASKLKHPPDVELDNDLGSRS